MAKIMLVEDDNNLREIYQARLAAEGYELVSAKDGEEALAIAVKEKPDLIVCDVMMPKVSGFEMLDILRSTAGIKDTKVIMMTALSQAEDRVRAEKLGADKYLVKSQVTLEDMAKTVKEVLNISRSDSSIGNSPEEALLSRAADTLNGTAPGATSTEPTDNSDNTDSDNDDDDNVKISKKTVIQPLHDNVESKNNFDKLLAKEQAAEELAKESKKPEPVVRDDEHAADEKEIEENSSVQKQPPNKVIAPTEDTEDE